MHYEDESRGLNLLTGLLFGALLGTGFVLLSRGAGTIRLPRRRRSRREMLERRLTALRGGMQQALAASLEAGAQRLGR